MGGGDKNEVTSSGPAEQKEGDPEQEANDACMLQESPLSSSDMRPESIHNNSSCRSVANTAPNYWSEVIKIQDSLAEDIARTATKEMETFLETFPSMYVDKTKKTEAQKAAIKQQKMLQVGTWEKEPPNLNWGYAFNSITFHCILSWPWGQMTP